MLRDWRGSGSGLPTRLKLYCCRMSFEELLLMGRLSNALRIIGED